VRLLRDNPGFATATTAGASALTKSAEVSGLAVFANETCLSLRLGHL
jgi:hypothetical protein